MIHAAVVTSSQRLFELLAAGHHAGGEAAALAEGLGLDVQADMTVLVWRPRQPASVLPAVLLRQLEAASDNFVVAYTDAGPAALVQASPARKPLHTIRQPPEAGALGVGLPRPGLAGAATSLRDAELALATLGPGPQQVVDFAEVWQDACGLSDLDRLAPLLATARNIAARHRHLAEAVAAYADRDMQLGPTAAALHLHPNTIAYRLDRWAQLTGWNPRTLTGIRRLLFVTSDMGTIASGSPSDNAVLR